MWQSDKVGTKSNKQNQQTVQTKADDSQLNVPWILSLLYAPNGKRSKHVHPSNVTYPNELGRHRERAGGGREGGTEKGSLDVPAGLLCE